MCMVINRIRDRLSERGFSYVLKNSIPFIYNVIIRKHLPRRITKINGIEVDMGGHLTDNINPTVEGIRRPHYEDGLIQGLQEYVGSGDKVIIIGGGYGVTTCIAAQETGPEGDVIVYEASSDMLRRAQDTLRRNGVDGHVQLREAIVGKANTVWRGKVADTVISGSDLPSCDVLELDCEGAEALILDTIEISPRVILVETHGSKGAPTDQVISCLKEKSYEITNIQVAETDKREYCVENDVKVVAAVNKAEQ